MTNFNDIWHEHHTTRRPTILHLFTFKFQHGGHDDFRGQNDLTRINVELWNTTYNVAWKFGLKLRYKYSYESCMKWRLYVILHRLFLWATVEVFKKSSVLAGLLRASG